MRSKIKTEELPTNTVADQQVTMDRITSDTPPAISVEQLDVLRQTHKTKSAIIRALAAEGLKTNMIAHTLLYHHVLSPRSAYQHVRNVLKTPLKRQQ